MQPRVQQPQSSREDPSDSKSVNSLGSGGQLPPAWWGLSGSTADVQCERQVKGRFTEGELLIGIAAVLEGP